MHFIVYTVKDVQLRRGKKKENISPQVFRLYACHVLESSKVSTDSVLFFFTPSTHPQILHKIETRPLTVVEHSFGKKVEYIQLIPLTSGKCFRR